MTIRNVLKKTLIVCLAISAPALAKPTHKDFNQTSLPQRQFYFVNFPSTGRIAKLGSIAPGADYGGKHTNAQIFAEANGNKRIPEGADLYFLATDFMGLEKPIDMVCRLPNSAITSISLSNNIFPVSELVKLSRFKNLRRLELSNTDITDESLRSFSTLPKLEAIAADRTHIKGRALVYLANCKSMKHLNLGHNDIDRKYLQELKNFPNLKWLSLDTTKLHDGDIANISCCSKLTFLDLTNNQDLTTAHIPELKKLKLLQILHLPFTKISARAVLTLKGLPLAKLRLCREQATTKDISELRKTFPGIILDFEDSQQDLKLDFKEAFE